MSSDKSPSIDVSVALILQAIFLGLKMIDVIDWSWLWVLSPLWGWFLLGIIYINGSALYKRWLVHKICKGFAKQFRDEGKNDLTGSSHGH